MRGAAADTFMYLYCKIPYIYVHLMTLLVKVYLLVIWLGRKWDGLE